MREGVQSAQWQRDLARSRRLFAGFRLEQSEPAYFYGLLAEDTVGQLSSHVDLAGATVVDIGGGPGYVADAMRGAGARVLCIDQDAAEMVLHGRTLGEAAVLGNAMQLPLRTSSVDVCFSSNVLEHVPDPVAMADEMLRVTRPGGTVFLSYTNWLSPWGGHETSPWHYFGGHRAARRYQRRTGKPPKNLYGTSMYGVSVATGIRWARRQATAEVIDIGPRYLPAWAGPIVRVPVLREFVTWNLAVVLRKR